jgi:hypothetical protein
MSFIFNEKAVPYNHARLYGEVNGIHLSDTRILPIFTNLEDSTWIRKKGSRSKAPMILRSK